jgi:hypothetical protein
MHKHFRNFLSAASLSVACLAGAAFAEIPNRSAAQLEELASHVFTGTVLKIYSTVDRSSPKWDFTYSVAEVQVDDIEKGEHEGRLAYVRFWHKRFKGDGPPEPSHYGHRGVPKIGDQTRVYVMIEEEDGGYDVLSPNGFAAIETPRQ